MTEAEQVMKRCQIGTRNYDEANNLHADCYRVIGKLLAEHAIRETQRLGQEIEQNSMSDEMLQAITDPENQPSQYGTVTLDYHFEKIKKWEDLFERMSNKVLQQLEQEPVAWLLTDKNINSLQVDSIQRLINRLNHAHHTDLCVRINGQDEWFQADWLKHMVRATPPQRTWVGLTDEQIEQLEQDTCAMEFPETVRAIEAAHGIKENT